MNIVIILTDTQNRDMVGAYGEARVDTPNLDRLHADDTVIIYTSDHGDMLAHHGLASKGPMMYEETCNVPFLVRAPGRGPAVSDAVISHLDILPTLPDLAAIDRPESLHGASLRPLIDQSADSVHDTVMLSFSRFAVNHDGWGARSWRTVREPFYYGGQRRDAPRGFPLQPAGLEATGNRKR